MHVVIGVPSLLSPDILMQGLRSQGPLPSSSAEQMSVERALCHMCECEAAVLLQGPLHSLPMAGAAAGQNKLHCKHEGHQAELDP